MRRGNLEGARIIPRSSIHATTSFINFIFTFFLHLHRPTLNLIHRLLFPYLQNSSVHRWNPVFRTIHPDFPPLLQPWSLHFVFLFAIAELFSMQRKNQSLLNSQAEDRKSSKNRSVSTATTRNLLRIDAANLSTLLQHTIQALDH